MSNNLNRFINHNREGFDIEKPPEKVWEQIEKDLNAGVSKPVHSLKKKSWSVAAAVVLTITLAAGYFLFNRGNFANQGLAKTKTDLPANDIDIAAIDPVYAQHAAHFSELIEEKQKELKAIQQDEPALYATFSFDVQRLDSAYTVLKLQLPQNPNKEELLEAMISNLQLQIELLNQQLSIIQKIKESKSKSL
ncbi:MAG TPA: hypothetical protein VFV68_01870 [Agriterribacter sp.]|nr:hypothetical protein [Agriterribacter sp.]